MNPEIISEIKRIKEITTSIEKKSHLNEDVLNDIKKLINIASDDMKKSENFKKVLDFYEKILSGRGSDTKTLSKNLTDFSTNDDDFYESVLQCIGAPITKDNMLFFHAWRQAEGGKASFNPFNTTKKIKGATPYSKNVDGVKNYPTKKDGIEATCATLKLPYYQDIVNGLKNDVGLRDLSRMKSLKTWGTGELLAKVVDNYLEGSRPSPNPISKRMS